MVTIMLYIYVCIPNYVGTFTHGINVCVYVCVPCIKVTMNACDVCMYICKAMPTCLAKSQKVGGNS